MTEPTDAEIDVMVAAYLGDCGPQATRVYSFARAVLAKWGTPQPARLLTRAQPVGQPDAYAAGMGDPLVVAAPTPQPAAQDADPLQGAADWLAWLAQAHGQFCVAVLQDRLMIGYNRAKRLHDAAIAAQQGDSHE